MKKILSVFLAALLLTLSPAEFTVYAKEISAENQNQSSVGSLTEEEVFEALSYTFDDETMKNSINSQKELSPSGALVNSYNADSYSEYTDDEYGGMYLNNAGILVICYVNGSDTAKIMKKANNNKLGLKKNNTLVNSKNEFVCEYKIKNVKYSEKELLSAYDVVNELAENEKSIKTTDVDVFQNRIIIGVSAKSDIEKISSELSLIDGMYAFELLDDDFNANNTASISSTSAIGNGSIATTPAGKLYSSALGKYGVVTCGHGWSLGDWVYTNSTKIGYVKYRNHSKTNDSSFIILYSGHSYNDTYNDEFDSSVPVVGSTLTLRGAVSGKIRGAKVLSKNSSVRCEGIYCTGLIKCNKMVRKGDSGGGAVSKIVDGGRTALIVGINKCIDNENTYLVKSKIICDAYK